MSNEFWVVKNYDALVKESATDGLTFQHSKKLLAEKWVEDVASGVLIPERLDLLTEGLDIVQKYLKPLRAVRRTKLKTVLSRIIVREDIDNDTISVFLNDSFPLGTDDGRDKSLRFWDKDDFETSVKMRYRKAAEATTAAREFDIHAETAILMIADRGVTCFGECFDLPQQS